MTNIPVTMLGSLRSSYKEANIDFEEKKNLLGKNKFKWERFYGEVFSGELHLYTDELIEKGNKLKWETKAVEKLKKKYFAKSIDLPETTEFSMDSPIAGENFFFTIFFPSGTKKRKNKTKMYLRFTTNKMFILFRNCLIKNKAIDVTENKEKKKKGKSKKISFDSVGSESEIVKEEKKSGSELDSIERLRYSLWSIQDVLMWMSCCLIDYDVTLKDAIGDKFVENDVKGFILDEWSKNYKNAEDELKEIGVKNLYHRKMFMSEFKALSEKGNYFNKSKYNICKKILSNPTLFDRNKVKISFSQFLEMAKAYYDVPTVTKRIMDILLSEYSEDEREEHRSDSASFQTKFIITENVNTQTMKRIRKVMGMILQASDKLDLSNKIKESIGLLHTAMSIGSLQLEWVSCELVILKTISSRNVLCCLDVQPIEISNMFEFASDLARFIIKWNAYMAYDSFSLQTKENMANCQQFILDLAKELKLNLVFSKSVNKYLEKLKYKGKAEITFEYSKKMKEEFKLEGSEFSPKTHQELDEFVIGLEEKNSVFSLDYSSEYQLLKGFDRAFWLKNIKLNSHLTKPSEKGCPFSKSTVTRRNKSPEKTQ